jgi:citrate synthase
MVNVHATGGRTMLEAADIDAVMAAQADLVEVLLPPPPSSDVRAEEILRWEKMQAEDGLSREEVATRVVADYDRTRARMPGVGHPLFAGTDPRAVAVREVAEKTGFVGDKTLLYEAVHAEYIKHPKRADLCINIDGRFACSLLELGFEPAETSIIAVLSLTPGVIADIMEQMRQKPSLQLMVGMPYDYTGEADRPLPDDFIRDRD